MLNKIKAMLGTSSENTTPTPKHDIALDVTALMVEVMSADDSEHDAEQQKIFMAIKQRFGLSTDEAKQLVEKAKHATEQATDFHQFTSRIKDHYSTEERIDVLKNLWEIAMADGHIDDYEEHLIRRIANLIGIYHGEFIQAKLHARKNI